MFTTLRPMLAATDLDRTISYYTDVLGFKCVGDFDHEGVRVWCSLQRDDTGLMFTLAESAHTHDDGSSHEAEIPQMTGSLYITTNDVDSLFSAIQERSNVLWPPCDQHYGMRDFGVKDPDGYVLIFGAELAP